MANDETDPRTRAEHPVATGLVALVGVGLVVGLILGGGVLAATKVLGFGGGGDTASDTSTSEQSMYLPKPEKTKDEDGPLVTLAPDPRASDEEDPDEEPSETEQVKEISLSAGQTEVSSMGRIDLTGTYEKGEGSILQVERFTAGRWEDFPVTVSVSNQTFATYVQTGQPGLTRFRVVDTDTGETSNEVRVRIG